MFFSEFGQYISLSDLWVVSVLNYNYILHSCIYIYIINAYFLYLKKQWFILPTEQHYIEVFIYRSRCSFLQSIFNTQLLDVVSGVPQGNVLGPLLFLLHTSELFSILENKLIVNSDDSTLMAVVPSPGIRVTVAESLIRDLGRVSECCDLWGMKLNVSKTKTMILSRSRTMHPQSPPLTIGGTVLKESDDLVILGVTFDSKLTFEKHLRLVSEQLLKDLVS